MREWREFNGPIIGRSKENKAKHENDQEHTKRAKNARTRKRKRSFLKKRECFGNASLFNNFVSYVDVLAKMGHKHLLPLPSGFSAVSVWTMDKNASK